MSTLPRPTGKELIRALERAGFVVERTRGSQPSSLPGLELWVLGCFGISCPIAPSSPGNSKTCFESGLIAEGYGESGGARTRDHRIKSAMLYQLSYRLVYQQLPPLAASLA